MAGERIGKTYEALLKVTLEYYRMKKHLKSQVFWNETPQGLTVEPDFLIGPDKDHPEIVFMVTHSGSSKNSDMKCWRNIGELCEVKSVLNPTPLAINIVFDSVMKENLKLLQAAAFDGQLIIGDLEYGSSITRWARAYEDSLPINQDEKADIIGQLVPRDKQLAFLITRLVDDIASIIQSPQTDLNDLWTLEKQRPHGSVPHSRLTSVRRGLSKLLVFEDLDNAIALYQGKQMSFSEIPDYAYTIGLARKAIGHPKGCDSEIQNAIDILPEDCVRYICNSIADNAVFQQMFIQLRYSTNLECCSAYVIEHFEELLDAKSLFSQLKELHDNPSALISEMPLDNWPPATVWLFDMILELIKASTGKANGYGYAQLAADVAEENGAAGHFSASTRQFLLSPWGHMSEWATRTDRGTLPDDVLRAVSCVLSSKLQEIGRGASMKLSTEMIASYVHNLLENKICTYRSFSPLALLLVYAGIMSSVSDDNKIRTCFAEKCGLSGQSGKTTVLHINNTIINWQTATDSGKDHKRKELCGRAVGLRYTWDSANGCFTKRPGVEKMILLLDGTWNEKDLTALINAGWDEIYYPDEIEMLKAAII